LSVVLNYVDLLKRCHRDDPDTERLLKIERELNRIGEIIGSLLSFSKVRKIPMEPLSVAHIIKEVVLLVDHKIREKSIDLRLPARQEEILIYGEENSLKQVFVNLLINSAEAVLERGTIEIDIKRIEPDDCVEISIVDDGCGIPAEIKDRIFDPFFSTKAGRKNTGLGLSICQHIVESHEGVILCESRGKTTLSVRLPVYRE
jgi:signal transduction histidine kinase